MKVLFLLTYYYPYWTGLTQYAKRLAEGLATRNHQVSVLTTQHEGALTTNEVINSVYVSRKHVLFRISRSLVSVSLFFSFFPYIMRTDCVVIFIPYAEVLLATIIAKLFQKKVILVHNGDLTLPEGFLNRLLEKVYYISTLFAGKLADVVVIQTEDYANHSKLLMKLKSKWKTIIPPFPQLVVDEKIKTILQSKIGDNKRVIGFAGRFVEEKGFDILLKAIPLVLKSLPKSVFVFAGETNIAYEKFYEKNVELIERNKKNIRFLGKLSQSEIGSFYKLCDVFVVSSRTDCFPFTLMEAMLLGIPAVVTNIPGARFVVRVTEMGKIIEKENPQALADGIIEVLKNKKSYTKNIHTLNSIMDYDKSLDAYEQIIRY